MPMARAISKKSTTSMRRAPWQSQRPSAQLRRLALGADAAPGRPECSREARRGWRVPRGQRARPWGNSRPARLATKVMQWPRRGIKIVADSSTPHPGMFFNVLDFPTYRIFRLPPGGGTAIDSGLPSRLRPAAEKAAGPESGPDGLRETCGESYYNSLDLPRRRPICPRPPPASADRSCSQGCRRLPGESL